MTEREKAKSERRHLILGAATKCFIKNGIHQTGVREIAKLAGISLGNLYNHFRSKEDLIAEIAVIDARTLEGLAHEINASEDPLIAVQEFVDHYLDYVSKAENAFLTIDILSESLRNATVASQFESNRKCLIDALSSTIERGISQGVMREQISMDETVKLLLDAIEGLGLRSGLAQQIPSEKARNTLQELVHRML